MEELWIWMRAEHGRVTRVAEVCIQPNGKPITPSAVHQWKAIPPEYATQIEALTGIPCHVLRPDVFPVREGQAA